MLLGKTLANGCDAKRLLLIAKLNERELVCGRMQKMVDTIAAFRLVGSKVYVCVASMSG